MKIIEEFYILRNGLVLFNYSESNKIDPNLFGGFMSSIEIFAQELGDNEKLSKLKFGVKTLFLFKDDLFLFIAVANNSIKSKKVHIAMEKLIDKFYTTYNKEELINWSGNLSIFEKFTINQEVLPTDVYNKLSKSFW